MKPDHLGIGVRVRYGNGEEGRQTPYERNTENQEMLQNMDPIYYREGGRQTNERDQFRQRDAKKE